MAFSFQPKTAGMDGLVLCLDAANTKSYPGSGTTWTDLSKTITSGSLTNGPTFSSTNGGNIFFDGTNDYVVGLGQLSDFSFIQNTGTYTISAWVRPSILGTAMYFAGNNSGTSIEKGFYFGKESSNNCWLVFTSGVSGQPVLNHTASNFFTDTSNWINVVAVGNGTYNQFYRNGVAFEVTRSFSSSFSSGNSTRTIGLGTINDIGSGSYWWSGSIASFQIYNRALSATEVLQNYNAICGRFGKAPTITDGDALSFVNAANISNETQQSAINTLVTDLKGAGLWSKMKAIYPFVGGTAASHKWNLKDPRDADAAFRLSFQGGWTHSSTGADPNGTNAYANSYLNNNQMAQNSVHISVYVRENIAGFMAEIGIIGPGPTRSSNYIFSREGVALPATDSFTAYATANQTNTVVAIRAAVTTSQGFTSVTRTSSTSQKLYKNGISLLESTQTSSTPSANPYYLGAINEVSLGTVDYYSSRQIAFATIGDGLTDTDAANLYTIVQKYQTTLGRQV